MNLYLFFSLFLFLHAEMISSSISSKKASYSGNNLVLKGDVEVDHSFGKMQSGIALLRKEEGDFSSISLQDNVRITLKNRGQIACAKADFDFQEMKGTLLPETGQRIQFTSSDSSPFSFSSCQAEIAFEKELDSLKIVKVQADGVVQLEFGNNFFLDSDTMTPFVLAEPNGKLTYCQNPLDREKVEIYPQSPKTITLSPKEKFKSSAFSSNEGIRFSCNRMIWEKAPQVLTLIGDISVHDKGIGNLLCEEEVELRQKLEDGKWILSSIIAKGKTELDYALNADFKHLLICYGLTQLDQNRLLLTLESPSEKQPIEYFHDKMKFCADHAQLNYSQKESNIHPEKLFLFGNVRLTDESKTSRCALAEQFTYFPKENKMILASKKGGVLFWDEEKGLSVHAKEVEITHGEHGENIKGIGNVRFSFSNAESSLLKQLFPFYRFKEEVQ